MISVRDDVFMTEGDLRAMIQSKEKGILFVVLSDLTTERYKLPHPTEERYPLGIFGYLFYREGNHETQGILWFKVGEGNYKVVTKLGAHRISLLLKKILHHSLAEKDDYRFKELISE